MQVNLELITEALAEVNPETRPITEDESEHEATIDMFETVGHGLADTSDQEIAGFDRYAFLRHCGILETTHEGIFPQPGRKAARLWMCVAA
jgi:hypothetical protein